MDTPGVYTWGIYKQHISSREIEKMKKNMKKVPVIQLKTEIYHNKESNEADILLKKLPQEKIQQTNNGNIVDSQLPWYKKILPYIYHLFTSSR